jgi:hypothetical protein
MCIPISAPVTGEKEGEVVPVMVEEQVVEQKIEKVEDDHIDLTKSKFFPFLYYLF